MRHLEGAMRLVSKDDTTGLCFHRSAAIVLDMPAATLCVGILPPADAATVAAHPDVDFSPVEFIHCWAELGDYVIPPSAIASNGSLQMVPKSVYYDTHRPEDVRRMSRAYLRKLSTEYGLAKHLLHFASIKDGDKFGDVILKFLGVAYEISDRGGVVPLR